MARIKSFSEFSQINENEEQTYDYGCSMVYYDFPQMNEIHSMIEEDDIYTEEGDRSFGLVNDPHTTLLYGIHSNEVPDEDVFNASMSHEIPTELKLHNASCFNSKKYDVLKFDVESEELHKINQELSKLPHTTDYPDYHPHSTIAYLKKGMGEKYTTKLKDKWYTVNPSKIVYSKPDGSKLEEQIVRN